MVQLLCIASRNESAVRLVADWRNVTLTGYLPHTVHDYTVRCSCFRRTIWLFWPYSVSVFNERCVCFYSTVSLFLPYAVAVFAIQCIRLCRTVFIFSKRCRTAVFPPVQCVFAVQLGCFCLTVCRSWHTVPPFLPYNVCFLLYNVVCCDGFRLAYRTGKNVQSALQL